MFWTNEERDNWLRESTLGYRRILSRRCDCALGMIDSAGYIRNGPGVTGKMRVLGRSALVLVVDGSAVYRDAMGTRRKLAPGDVMLVAPEIGHRYGPAPGGRWTEFHVVFDGPIFEICRHEFLDPAYPIYSLAVVDVWLGRFEALFASETSGAEVDDAVSVSRLLALIMEIVATRPASTNVDREPDWLVRTKRLIEARLSDRLSVAAMAAEIGLTYDGFRRSFQVATGRSPTQYHFDRRIEAACALLNQTRMTNRQIADSLGFCDEYHFSTRFHAKTGLRPGMYRRKQQVSAGEAK
jgi:AraC-like DNA-binding protein